MNKDTILVIEYDTTSLRIIANYLCDRYRVIVSTTAKVGLSLLNQKPDLVVLDLGLPDLHGKEVIKLIRAKEETKNTPIIIATADRDDQAIEDAFLYGANDYMVKPYIQKILQARIHLLIDNQKKTKALEELSVVDSLTSIPNRRGFDVFVENEWVRHERENTTLGLLMVDADHFKKINDHYGHYTGDECLKELARCIDDFLNRKSDFFGRLGGEEFIIGIPNTNINSLTPFAEAIIKKVESHFKAHALLPDMTISIGGGCASPKNTRIKDFIKWIDENLYSAKDAGRNCAILSDYVTEDSTDKQELFPV